VLAPQIDGQEILTVEGLAMGNQLHPLQESFLTHDAVHCGFCTPGMLMSAKDLLDHNPDPTEERNSNCCLWQIYAVAADTSK